MITLEELYFSDWKKWIEGKLTTEEFEKRFECYEQEYGKEAVGTLFTNNTNQEPLFNMAESYEGFDELMKISEEGWKTIGESFRLENENLIGKFLVAWLGVEHTINQLILEKYQVASPGLQKFIETAPISKRLKELKPRRKLYSRYLPLLYELKDIRNGLAHSLRFNLDEIRIGKELERYLSEKIKGQTREEVIISLLDTIRFYLLLEAKALREKRNKIISENPSLKHLLL